MTPQDLVRGSKGFYALPEVAIKVQSLVEQSASCNEIADAILLDPVISAKTLSIANSPLYGMSGRIDTICRAITIIGAQAVRDIVISSYVVDSFSTKGASVTCDNDFWGKSIFSGILCRNLAVAADLSYTEPMFLSGLFHEIGSLVIYEKFPDACKYYNLLAKKSDRPLHEIETEQLGFNHADVGKELLLSWGLPFTLQEAVACHHSPLSATRYPLGAGLLCLASMLAECINPYSFESIKYSSNMSLCMAITGINEDIVAQCIEHSTDQYSDILNIFIDNAQAA